MPKEQQQINYSIIIMIVLTLLVIAFICAGCRGRAGLDGANGLHGQIGETGPVGAVTSVYTSLATPSECPTGGLDVTIGNTTTSICNGLNGNNGQDGTNATPVIFEQVCQGITPSYPSSFPEYVMNVNGIDYGVYSANGGFLALLPPGTYSSNGINASCTFVINQDGSIAQ